jgi:hypothetical protein
MPAIEGGATSCFPTSKWELMESADVRFFVDVSTFLFHRQCRIDMPVIVLLMVCCRLFAASSA